MITILNEQLETKLPEAKASGDSLWLDREDIERAVGWTWKPEGLCQGDTCIPLPGGQSAALVKDNLLDIAAVWRHMGNPVVHDKDSSTWVFGAGSSVRTNALATLEAPDFALPDLNGRMHKLSDYRGKKVFLATWASW